jgi:hypothetical protein
LNKTPNPYPRVLPKLSCGKFRSQNTIIR